MKREFLEGLGLDKETVDKIMTENGNDINTEKRRTESAERERDNAKNDLAAANATLTTVRGELETLKKSNGDTAALQKQLDDLQKKYTTDTEALKKQISDRAYTDAMADAVKAANDGKGVKFTSKGAKASFMSALREKSLELKDGKLDKDGFDAFLKAQKEADPDAFASDTPAPRFAGRIGAGGAPDNTPANVAQAKAMGAAKAQTLKASSDVFSHYT